MSYQSNIIQACPAIQGAINEKWITGAMPMSAEPSPLLEYVASPSNRTGIQLDIVKSTGQLGVAEVTYLKRFLTSQVQTDVASPSCTGGDKFGNEKASYTFDPTKNIATPMQLVESVDYINACPDPAAILAEQVARHMDLLDRAVAAYVATEVAAGAGKWGATVPVNADVFELKSLKVDGESIDPRAHIKITNALQDSGFPIATPLFGGHTGREYYQASQIGCCSNEGLGVGDALAQFGKAFGYDFYLQQALGADKWLAVMPQAVQLLNWNKAVLNQSMGPVFLQTADYQLIPMTSPRTGLTYDVEISNNCGQLRMRMIAYVQPIFLPSDLFSTGDNLEGVNGVAVGEFVNCPAPECAEA
jgi:hypothetical protein